MVRPKRKGNSKLVVMPPPKETRKPIARYCNWARGCPRARRHFETNTTNAVTPALKKYTKKKGYRMPDVRVNELLTTLASCINSGVETERSANAAATTSKR